MSATEAANRPDTAAAKPVIWTEIRVQDLDAAARFYGAVLGVELTETVMGPTRTFVLPYPEGGISMNLQEGQPGSPGAGSVVHFTVPDVATAAARVAAAGGKTLSPPIEIPPGRTVYCADPAGNTSGVFTPRGA